MVVEDLPEKRHRTHSNQKTITVLNVPSALVHCWTTNVLFIAYLCIINVQVRLMNHICKLQWLIKFLINRTLTVINLVEKSICLCNSGWSSDRSCAYATHTRLFFFTLNCPYLINFVRIHSARRWCETTFSIPSLGPLPDISFHDLFHF